MKMMSNFKFSPRELSYNVENESSQHKMRIFGGALALALVAGGLQAYYDDMSFRATQAQIHYLGGNSEYGVPEMLPEKYSDDMWYIKNNLAIH